MSSDADVTGQEQVARELKRYREEADLSLNKLAGRIGYSRTHVSNIEKPGGTLASAAVVRLIDEELGAGGALIELRERADAERQARRASAAGDVRHVGPTEEPSAVCAGDAAGDRLVEIPDGVTLEPSIIEILGPAHALAVVDEVTLSAIQRYELEGPVRLVPEVQALRQLCRKLSGRVTGTADRVRFVRVAARQAALLAYMSVNLDRHADAERFSLEATMLATAAGDIQLLAWVKGTQSFAAYYQRRYVEALNLARVGLRFDPEGGQRVRLLVNGVARAAGKLGERAVVDRAVNTAFESLDETNAPAGMTPCIDFAPYGPARTTANAVTAYLSVGDYPRALHLIDKLRDTLVESDSAWSRSLVQLDEASALTQGGAADLDHAVAIGVEALAEAAHMPIASVAGRATELAGQLRLRAPLRQGRDFADALQAWKPREPSV